MRDVFRSEAVRALQTKRGFDGRLSPPAHRIGLEVLLANAPARAQIGPILFRIGTFDGDRRRPRVSVAREPCGGDADMGTPSGAVLHHAGRIAGTQYLPAWTEVFGDAQRLPDPRLVKGQEPRRNRGASDRVPRTGAMVFRHAGVLGHACTGGDLVTEYQTGEELAPVDGVLTLGAIAKCEQRGKNCDARVAFGKHVAVVPIDRIDGRSTRKRGAGNARPPAIEQHARSLIAPAEL